MVKLKKKVERAQRMTGCNTYIQEQIFPIPYSFKNMLNLKYPYLSLWLFYQKWQSVQSVNSHVRLFVTTWTAAYQASMSVTRSQSMLKLMSIKSMMPSNHLVLCCPLLLLPSILPSIRVFSNESALCIRWPKYCSFSFSISPSNEYSGLICFRMDLLDFLAVQGTLKSLLQHHTSKASILQPSAFFGVQLSHLHTTAEKTTALTRWTFVSKVMSAFWYAVWVGYSFSFRQEASFNFMAAVTILNDFGAQENKFWHCFHCSPIYLPWSKGARCHDLRFLNVEL